MKKQEMARIMRRENKRMFKNNNNEIHNKNNFQYQNNVSVIDIPIGVDIFYIFKELTSG